VLRSRNGLHPDFLSWATLNDLLIQAIESHSEGLSYPAINASDLIRLKIPVPPAEEQLSIASKLANELAGIDALIEKNSAFIDLLKEKRVALITAAVTGQIDLREDRA
jgi:type I restriction enzyme, S subunit